MNKTDRFLLFLIVLIMLAAASAIFASGISLGRTFEHNLNNLEHIDAVTDEEQIMPESGAKMHRHQEQHVVKPHDAPRKESDMHLVEHLGQEEAP